MTLISPRATEYMQARKREEALREMLYAYCCQPIRNLQNAMRRETEAREKERVEKEIRENPYLELSYRERLDQLTPLSPTFILGIESSPPPAEKPAPCPLCGGPTEWRHDLARGWGGWCSTCKGLSFDAPGEK